MTGDFREQPDMRAKGRVGEDDAVRWLTAHGYEILARNVVNHGGELDVVATDGGTVCFLEIKARNGDRYGRAIEAVGFAKQRRLSRAAALYLASRGWFDRASRFDVLGLDREGDAWRYTLIKNAFPYNPGPPRRRW
ncbi:MAG TPA: YraN family protein [Thermoanaerobaculia bacterium]|nr:YraN family protein [Thermoanaerobaculia bacterium]